MSSLDNDRRRNTEPGWQPGDVDANIAVKPIEPFRAYGEALAAAGADDRIGGADRHGEVGMRFAYDQSVGQPITTVAPRIGHPHQIAPIGGGDELEPRITAEPAFAVVVVFVMEGEDRQAIGGEFGAD